MKKKGGKPLADQFRENMSSYGVLDKVCVLIGHSSQYVDRFSHIHLLFIDGDHSISGCHYDFDHFHIYVVPGGYIVFQDFDANREDLGPTHVITHKILNYEEFKPAGEYGSLWIAQKTYM